MPLSKHATGTAAKTVASRATARDVVLYGSWFCPFVQRVWIALEHKNIPYEYVEVDPYDKTPELLRLNPRGLVPAITYHGKCLYESSIILEFLEEAFPDHGPMMAPLTDPYKRAQERIWVDYINKKLVPDFYRLLQTQDPDKQASAKEDFITHLKTFEEALTASSPEGPFFSGQQLGLVDVSWAPWALRYDNTLKHYRGFELPQELSRLHAWHKALLQQDAVLKTVSEDAEMVAVYQRYADNSATSEVAMAIKAGKGLP